MEKELKCENCGRHLGVAKGTIVAELKCGNTACRSTTQFKIVNSDPVSDIRYKFLTEPVPPKKKEVKAEVS